MRSFDETDREKKKARINTENNPAALSEEMQLRLKQTVEDSLRSGYLPCPIAWKIAENLGIPRIAVGEISDKLGIRITECQIGCFKVDKTLYLGPTRNDVSDELHTMFKALEKQNQLTCENVFELAKKFEIIPMVIGNEASVQKFKIHQCQLGCF